MKILLLLVVVAVVALMLMRTKKGKTHRTINKPHRSGGSKSPPRVRTNPYSATSISFDDTACEAVRAIGDKVFLDADKNTPLLPLPDCAAKHCNCKYVHEEDRRGIGEDRRHPSGLQAELYDTGANKNRRQQKRGRRSDDTL